MENRQNTNESATLVRAAGNTNSQEKLTIWKIVRATYRTICIIIHNVYCIVPYFVWMLVLRPVLWFAPDMYWEIEGVLFNWLLTIVGYWLRSAGYTVAESGADVRCLSKDEALVLINHQSTADVPLIMYTFSHHGRVLNSLLWIMELIFKFTNFGWVSMMHGDYFILQGRDTRAHEIVRLHNHMRTVYCDRSRKWVLLFPEGGFLRKRRESSHRYAVKNGYPILQNVTLPRIGAMKAIIDSLTQSTSNATVANGSVPTTDNNTADSAPPKAQLKWLIDMTIGYPHGDPLDAFCIMGAYRAPCETKIHYRVYPISDIPRDENALQDWVFQRWVEKDLLLKVLYETGQFPTAQNGPADRMAGNVTQLSDNFDEMEENSTSALENSTHIRNAFSQNSEQDLIKDSEKSSQVAGTSAAGVDQSAPSSSNGTNAPQASCNTQLNSSQDYVRSYDMLSGERKLVTDEVYIYCLHVFFIVSLYVQYYIISDVIGLFI